MEQIKGLLIGLFVFGFIIAIVGLGTLELSTNYGSSYDNTTVTQYTAKLQGINNTIGEIRTKQTNSSTANPLDMVGDILNSGIASAKLLWFSYDTTAAIGDQALSDAHISNAGLVRTLIVSVMLVIFVFAFLYLMTGRK